jgi:hypothetical protein
MGRICNRNAKRNARRLLVGKPEVLVKRALGRPRLRWVYNVKLVIEEL